MSKGKERICRLCLEISESNYVLIEDYTREICDALMLTLDLLISEEPVICSNCIDNMQKAFDFKSTLSKEEYDPKENKSEAITINIDLCGLCNKYLEKGSFNSLKVTEGVLQKCFPELNSDTFQKTMICTPCKEGLESYSNFFVNCWNTEENIKKYCEDKGTDNNGQILLSDVKKHFIKTGYDYFDFHTIPEIKKEENEYENKHICPDTDYRIKIERLDMEDEYKNHKSDTSSEVYPFETESDCKLASKNCLREPKHSEIRQNEVAGKEIKKYKCDVCSYETKYPTNFNTHVRIHKPLSEVEVFKCTVCTYESISKYNLKRHMQVHGYVTTYKCGECTFETNRKMYLRSHMLIHNDTSDVPMYKCKICSFKTKRKYALGDHMLSHKESSETTMFKCEMCTFGTKYKRSLEQHMLTHKNNTEVDMYKCDKCTFESKHKLSYKRHMLVHKPTSEFVVNVCDLCGFKTKREEILNHHMLLHTRSSGITVYKCDLCTFETIYNGSLKRHALTHEDSSMLTMYKCELCVFESKHKKNLDCHMKTHKSNSEVRMYKCGMCSFGTKYKYCLRRHALCHEKYENS